MSEQISEGLSQREMQSNPRPSGLWRNTEATAPLPSRCRKVHPHVLSRLCA